MVHLTKFAMDVFELKRSEIMKYANTMADLIGNTPLVKLQKKKNTPLNGSVDKMI